MSSGLLDQFGSRMCLSYLTELQVRSCPHYCGVFTAHTDVQPRQRM
jgi:hypothetical protein